MLQPFQLYEPTTVPEASSILGDLGDQACAYAGGTELLLAMKHGLLRYAHLVNVKRVGLGGISFDEEADCLRIGATATHREVERSALVAARLPLLSSMERHLANVRVRAVGTAGGNLCFAEPHSDLATVLLLHNATVKIGSVSGTRAVGIADFLVDAYTTCLHPGELLLEIAVPRLSANIGAAYRKFAFLERPTVGVGAALVAATDRTTVAEARIAVGCVGPTSFRAAKAEARLAGVPLAGRAFETALREAADEVARGCHPVNDLYGSGEYKRHLAMVLTKRAITAARNRLRGETDDDGE